MIYIITDPLKIRMLKELLLKGLVRVIIGKGVEGDKMGKKLVEGMEREERRNREEMDMSIKVFEEGFDKEKREYQNEYGKVGLLGMVRLLRIIRKNGAMEEIKKLLFTSVIFRVLTSVFRIPGKMSGILPETWVKFRRVYIGNRYSLISIILFFIMRVISGYWRTSMSYNGCFPYTVELMGIYKVVGVVLILNMLVLIVDLGIGILYGIYTTRVYNISRKGKKGLMGKEGVLNMFGLILKGILAVYIITNISKTLF